MANTFITPSTVARLAYANLFDDTILPQLVYRDFSGDFAGSAGDTVTIRKPATFTANTYAGSITVQDATEQSDTVTLDTHLDVSFAVTSKQWTLEVRDFNQQLIEPATEALAQGIEDNIISTMSSGFTQTQGTDGTVSTDPTDIITARRTLRDAGVPMNDLFSVLSTEVAANYLKDPLFHQADQRGDTAGLREASIGRKFGFDNFEHNGLTASGTDTTSDDSYFFHRTAVSLVSRTLALPRGAAQAAVFSARGFGIRVVYDYDNNAKQDVISLDVLIGSKVLDANRGVKLLA